MTLCVIEAIRPVVANERARMGTHQQKRRGTAWTMARGTTWTASTVPPFDVSSSQRTTSTAQQTTPARIALRRTALPAPVTKGTEPFFGEV